MLCSHSWLASSPAPWLRFTPTMG